VRAHLSDLFIGNLTSEKALVMANATVIKKAPAKAKAGVKKAAVSVKAVQAWQDDPISGLAAIPQPIPNLAKAPLKFKFKGTAVPAGNYAPGTAQFRYWNTAAALRRGADFMAPILGVTRWQPGATLTVGLDEGVDLNAFYDRTELAFFHATVAGKDVFSNESPDVVCHEMGHACLDSIRPELWDTPFVEAGAFHESMGDMTAILSALQLPEVRTAALSGVAQRKSSQLSRLAEQLGWAIRQSDPSGVDPDCLRNAFNSFNYVNPQTLPDSAPATQNSAEVHSFSRIFTGAFYDILSGMLNIRSTTPKESDLAAIAVDAARLLVDAIRVAPIQPNYYAQVASHMIDADTARFAGKYRTALVSTFTKRKILAAAAMKGLANVGKIPKSAFSVSTAAMTEPVKQQNLKVVLNAQEFGIAAEKLIVPAPMEQKTSPMVSMALAQQHPAAEANVEAATHRFVKMLFAHDRVETGVAKKTGFAAAPNPERKLRTHELVESAEGLKLVRRRFLCGCRV
jgi:hypothetical protein